MRTALCLARLACLVLTACDSGELMRPDAGPGVDSGQRVVDAGGEGPTELEGGEVTDDLCGAVTALGAITIPAGADVTVCAGSAIELASGASITVLGTLRLAGTEAARIQLSGADARWAGMLIEGTLEADFTDVYDAERALTGGASSTIRFDDGLIYARATDSARLANGGTFDRTRVFDGGTFTVTGGALRMTDSEIDLDHPTLSPDCLAITNAELALDHVRLTNCHCPLHINSASAPISVTNGVFDGASYPVMIARASGTFTGNVFSGTRAQIQDIGGGIDVDLAGNYYEGDAPILDTDDASQFGNVDAALTERPAGAGPR